MNHQAIKRLLEGDEPIAVIRYFEWAIFSRSYDHTKYIVLRINYLKKDIEEISVPDKLTPFLASKLPELEKVIQEKGGSVWERHNFRAKVKRTVPRTKIHFYITHS